MNNRINSIFQIQPEVYFRSFHSYNTSLNHLQSEADNSLKSHVKKYHLVITSDEVEKLSNGLYYKGIDQLITEVNVSLKSYYEETSQLMSAHDVSNLYVAFARDIENVIKKSKQFKYGSLYSDLLSDSGYLESAFKNVSSLPDESYVLGNRSIQSLIPSTNILFDNSNKDVLNTLLSGIGNVLTGVVEIITLDFEKGLKHILNGITDIASDTIDNFFGNIKIFLENTPGLNELISKSPLAKSIWDIAFKVGQEVATYFIFQGLDKLVKAGKISEKLVKNMKVFAGEDIENKLIHNIRTKIGYLDFQEGESFIEGIINTSKGFIIDKAAGTLTKKTEGFLKNNRGIEAEASDFTWKTDSKTYKEIQKKTRKLNSDDMRFLKRSETYKTIWGDTYQHFNPGKIFGAERVIAKTTYKTGLKELDENFGIFNNLPVDDKVSYLEENESLGNDEKGLRFDFEFDTLRAIENNKNSIEKTNQATGETIKISIKGDFQQGMLRDKIQNHFVAPD